MSPGVTLSQKASPWSLTPQKASPRGKSIQKASPRGNPIKKHHRWALAVKKRHRRALAVKKRHRRALLLSGGGGGGGRRVVGQDAGLQGVVPRLVRIARGPDVAHQQDPEQHPVRLQNFSRALSDAPACPPGWAASSPAGCQHRDSAGGGGVAVVLLNPPAKAYPYAPP